MGEDGLISMASVIERMDQQLVAFKTHKLWQTFFQEDRGLDAALASLRAFAPVISYFIMAFRDLNELVLPYGTPENSLQKAINEHAEEDSTHYKLFIEDWEKLGGDELLEPYDHLIPGFAESDHRAIETTTFDTMQCDSKPSISTKMLSFLWCDLTNKHNRKLLYDCVRLVNVSGDDPVVRFAIIETVEETGLVFFTSTSKLAHEIAVATGLELRYFGNYHLALETGHLMNQEKMMNESQTTDIQCQCSIDETFRKLSLTESQYKKCIQAVDCVADIFTKWLDNIYDMMMKSKKNYPFKTLFRSK